MARKTNDMLLFAALIVVALAIILQVFAMKSILANDFDGEEYTVPKDIEGYDDITINIYPTVKYDKEAIDKQYSKYKHVSEDGKSLVIFTKEQFDELSQLRQDKKRNALSIEEVLYIIEDSIDIYFSYDQITLTGNRNFTDFPPLFSSSSSLVPIFPYLTVSRPTDIENFRPFDSFYERVISDIYRIIYFRLSTHDSGLLNVYEMTKHNESVLVTSADDLSELYMDGWRLEMVKYVMLINESASIDENYENDLKMHFHTYLQNHRETRHEEALSFYSIAIQNPAVTITDGGKEIVVWDIKTLGALKIFPTSSLEVRAKEIYDKWLSDNPGNI